MESYILLPKELQALRVEHRRQLKNSGRAADRVKVIYLLGGGWQVKDISDALLIDEGTIRNYFESYKSGGVKKLLATSWLGSEKRLTDEEIFILDAHLQEVTYPRVKDIIEYVKEEFDVEYSVSGMTNFLLDHGYSYKKPTKEPKKTDLKAQLSFLKLYRKLRKNMGASDGLYFMDAVHPHHSPISSYGWIKKGEEKSLKTNPQPKRLNINGAINIDTLKTVVQFEESLTKESTKDFLELLRRHQPKGYIYLLCDNAGYYISPEVEEYAKSMAIIIIHFPPYSPNLNLIERLWLYFQKNVLHNRYYPSLDEMQLACKGFFIDVNLKKHQESLETLLVENFQIIGVT